MNDAPRGAVLRRVRELVASRHVREVVGLVAASFVVLHFVPDVDVGPYGALNPQHLVRIAIAVLGVGIGAEIAASTLGERNGSFLTGLVGGFLSSTATIAAMGVRSRADARNLGGALSAALASNVATVCQYGIVVASVDVHLLLGLAVPFGLALAAAIGVAAFAARAVETGSTPTAERPRFGVVTALLVSATSGVLAILSAACSARLGAIGTVYVSAIAGLVDAHATAGSVASLHEASRIPTSDATLALIAALTANSATKVLLASLTGTRSFALPVVAGVMSIVLAAWLGYFAVV